MKRTRWMCLFACTLALGCGKADTSKDNASQEANPEQASGTPAKTASGSAKVFPELAMIPSDALGFAVIDWGTLWKHEAIQTLLKLKGFEGSGYPVDDIDHVTEVIVNTEFPLSIYILKPSRKFDKDRFATAILPTVGRFNTGGKGVTNLKPTRDSKGVYELSNHAVYFSDDRTCITGASKEVRDWLQRTPKPLDGPLAAAVDVVGRGHSLVAAVNPKAVKNLIGAMAPKELQPLLDSDVAVLSLDLGKNLDGVLLFNFPNAGNGMKVTTSALEMGRASWAKMYPDMLKWSKDNHKPSDLLTRFDQAVKPS